MGSVVDVVDEPALEVVGALGFCGPESGVGDLGAEGPVAALAILSGRPDTRSEAIIARSITTLIHQASGAPLWRRPGVSLSPRRHRCTRRTSRQRSSSPCCPRPRPPPARRIYATRRSSRGRWGRPPPRWDGAPKPGGDSRTTSRAPSASTSGSQMTSVSGLPCTSTTVTTWPCLPLAWLPGYSGAGAARRRRAGRQSRRAGSAAPG